MLARLLCLALLLSVTSATLADHDAILVCTKAGCYELTLDATGLPKLTLAEHQYRQVIVMGEMPGPGPVPTPPPSPSLTTRGIAIRDAALKATADKSRDRTAMMLSVLYSEIAKRVRSGELKGADTIATISRTGADMVLAKSAAESTPVQQQSVVQTAWSTLRDTLGSQWIAAVQEGATDASLAGLLDECSAGLSASVSRQSAEGFDLQQLLSIIKLILDLITQLFPKGLPAGFPK